MSSLETTPLDEEAELAASDPGGPRFDRIFVVTYGRSGSTLLQGLLNAIPGYRVYGENGGFLTALHEAHDALAEAHRHVADPSRDLPVNAWYGASRYQPPVLTTAFRDFADRMLFGPDGPGGSAEAGPAVRVFGFKEIRYGDLQLEALERFLDFARALWPRGALVFNSRDLDDVVTSGWWRNDAPEKVRARLSRFDAFAANYTAAHPDHAIHLAFDRLVKTDRAEVGRLMEFLGESAPADDLEAVFSQNHSWANKSLTEYLMGRAEHVRLFEHDWWRSYVDDFRLDLQRKDKSTVARGFFLPAARGAAPWLVLRTSAGDAEVVGETATPRLANLFPANPASEKAGFRLEMPSFEEAQLVVIGEGGERLVGRVKVAP